MGKIPDKRLMRRGEVMDALGLESRDITDLVESGRLIAVRTKKGGRMWFRRCDVVALAGKDNAP